VCQTTVEPTKTLSNILKLLVAKVCCLSDIVENIPNPGTPYVEPTLNLTPCLQYENDTSTQLKLEPYVLRMAAFLCQVNSAVETNSSDIVELQGKVAALENAPDPTPQISSCLLQGLEDIDVVVEELEQQFCSYKTALGTIGDINIVPTRQCEDLNGALQLATREPMVNLNGWKTNVQSLAQSLNNLWLTVCDIRDAVSLIQSSCCQTSCDDIVVDFDYVWDDELLIKAWFLPKTNLPAGFWDCAPAGSTYRVVDGLGNTKTVNIPLRKQNPADTQGALTNPLWVDQGYPIDLSPSALDTTTGLTITANLCFTNGDVTCIKCFTKEIGPYVNKDCCTLTSSTVNTIVYRVCYNKNNT
jgi:hypothetical protein